MPDIKQIIFSKKIQFLQASSQNLFLTDYFQHPPLPKNNTAVACTLCLVNILYMKPETSKHILNTASNLLGFCLFVITSIHSSNYSATSIMDEFTSAVALILVFSCLFSFYSLRSSNPDRAYKSEKIAELLFGLALVGILVIVILLLFKVIV